MSKITRVSGVTLQVTSMKNSFRFYHDLLGLKLRYGGEDAQFSSFEVAGVYLNLQLSRVCETRWGRIILYSTDVDEMYSRLKEELRIVSKPQNAPWGERFFHIKDPDGHELSIAEPLSSS